ncbi:hypothetical protein [Nonomuraea sp. NPDC050786]
MKALAAAYGPSPTINVVMLYGPRSAQELETARSIVAASYRYATGRAL